MSIDARDTPPSSDPMSDALVRVFALVAKIALALIALPLVVPCAANKFASDMIATRTRFWRVFKFQWLVNALGVLVVVGLLLTELVIGMRWIHNGDAGRYLAGNWRPDAVLRFGPWAIANFVSGVCLLPVAWSWRRRQIAERVRTRQVTDVLRQERIEAARKRAADLAAARRMGVELDAATGRISGLRPRALTVPHKVGDRQSFGFINRATVRLFADRFHDLRTVRDWVDDTGEFVVLPETSSAVRALLVAESGSGKTVLINGLVMCAIEQHWPVFVIDAKGDPVDAEGLVRAVQAQGHTAAVGGAWNLFNGTAEQVTAKLMRLMPPPDGANQHYLDEIRGVLQAVQDERPLSSVHDLRERLSNPGPYVRDQFDLSMVNQSVDRNGTTAGLRALHSLLIALRPLERLISEDGWCYSAATADVTVIPLSPVDEAQAKLGDLLMLDLRGFLASRLEARDKSPIVVIVDEFPQLVTGGQDPGDTAGSLFETARSAGVGLVLATQSPAGLSNDETRRRRALTSGAALIFGRSKDPEDVVKYAGTVLRMESSTRTGGAELGSGRAQHTFVIPPQDVREAADGAFWLVQAGAIAPFRALPQAHAGATPTGMAPEPVSSQQVGVTH